MTETPRTGPAGPADPVRPVTAERLTELLDAHGYHYAMTDEGAITGLWGETVVAFLPSDMDGDVLTVLGALGRSVPGPLRETVRDALEQWHRARLWPTGSFAAGEDGLRVTSLLSIDHEPGLTDAQLELQVLNALAATTGLMDEVRSRLAAEDPEGEWTDEEDAAGACATEGAGASAPLSIARLEELFAAQGWAYEIDDDGDILSGLNGYQLWLTVSTDEDSGAQGLVSMAVYPRPVSEDESAAVAHWQEGVPAEVDARVVEHPEGLRVHTITGSASKGGWSDEVLDREAAEVLARQVSALDALAEALGEAPPLARQEAEED